jgi:carboxymethylenebutenolidase
MERKKASDFPQELLDLFDGYVHGGSAAEIFWMAHKNSRSAA